MPQRVLIYPFGMGRRSRAKRDKIRNSNPELGRKGYLPEGIGRALLFIVSVYVICFGLSAMRYSRWNHAANARIEPVYHPWAIVLGIVLLVISLKMKGKSSDPS